jgi:hypothetical protein
MTEYRLYFLHRYSGQIVRTETFNAADDRTAVADIQQRGSPEAMELWCGSRKVMRLEAELRTASSAC